MQRRGAMKLENGASLMPWLLKESHGFYVYLTILYNLCTGSQDRFRKRLLVFLNEKHIVFSNLLTEVDQS